SSRSSWTSSATINASSVTRRITPRASRRSWKSARQNSRAVEHELLSSGRIQSSGRHGQRAAFSMSGLVTLQRVDSVALITIDHPPVNALAQPVRAELLEQIVLADEDPCVAAIVLHGAGKNFVAGADIRELDAPPRAPLLNDVLLRVEACRKPVIAALHGMT